MMLIVCLANSYKGSERCIAGLDVDTKQWIRPISSDGEGAIDSKTRLVNGQEPGILDIIEIPLGNTGHDYGCQPENRFILPGKWKKIRTVTTKKLMKYIENTPPLLHNNDRKIHIDEIEKITNNYKKSLQLIHVNNANFFIKEWPERNQHLCKFAFHNEIFKLPVKDPLICDKLNHNKSIKQNCLLTISLTSPYSRDQNSRDQYCYKLVAGVIEI